MAPYWRIQLLGGLRAVRTGEEPARSVTRFRVQKAGALLAYLAYHVQRSHPREILIERFWTEESPEVARHKLSVALSFLRHDLEPPGIPDGAVILADRFTIGLNPAAVTTDVSELERSLRAVAGTGEADRRIELLAAGAELYGGELLPGCYEEWIFPEQQRLGELFQQLLQQLITLLEQTGDVDRALRYALQASATDRLSAQSHCRVMRLYAAAGRPAAALRHYEEARRVLKQEMDLEPPLAMHRLAQQIEKEQRAGTDPAGERDEHAAQEPAAPREAACDETASGIALGPPLAPGDDISSAPPAPEQMLRADLEPIGGAVPLGSQFYLRRAADEALETAILRRHSIVLLKGARQVGKSSLLARGLQRAREQGLRVALTDLQALNASDLQSVDSLLRTLGGWLADQLGLDALPADVWEAHRGPNLNFSRYMRRAVLPDESKPLVWALDEVDRLFGCEFGSEVFALFRSWHNERAFDPSGPWARLTLAIAYRTEAHLLIPDANRSPFNVGTQVELEDFTFEQLLDLNRRYGSPLRDPDEAARYYRLVGGHPYLVRCGLHEMAAHGIRLEACEARAERDDWIFGDHLQRLLGALRRNPVLCEALLEVIRGRACPNAEDFFQLRSLGLIAGDSAREAHVRCRLYASYLDERID